MIVKTAVCAGDDTWLPQVSCREDDCITEHLVITIAIMHLGANNYYHRYKAESISRLCNSALVMIIVIILQVRLLVIPHLHVLVVLLVQQCW